MTHLWEVDHPYYCAKGNFYTRPDQGLHTAYETWSEFFEYWGDLDDDHNLVFRWDWIPADPDDYTDGEQPPADRLLVFWVLQRKAILRSTECVVTEADEPAVRQWLERKAKTISALWEPILPTPSAVGGKAETDGEAR